MKSRASRCLAWILALCALASVVGCGGAKSRFASHLERGERYLDAGVLDKAGVEFRNALQIEPRDAQARYLNGLVAERQGGLRQALGYYQAAIEADPDYTTARAALGRVLVFAGASARALPIIETGLLRHPEDPQLLAARAGARAQQDIEAAIADGERAVRLAPDNEQAVALLAALYQRHGDVSRAIELVTGTVSRKPRAIDLRQVLASLYLLAHENARCEAQLREIITLAPHELPRRYALAAFYQRSGNGDAAQRILEEAVSAFPNSNAAKLALVDFIVRERSREQGERTLRAYLSHDGENQTLRLALGELLQRSGAMQDALSTYGEVVSRDAEGPAALTARNRMVEIDISTGKPAAAQPLLAAVLQRDPHNVDALLMRGNLALNAGNPAATIADLRAVLRDLPGALEVQRALARAYMANGEPALAEETLRASVQAAPASVPARRDLAQLLLQSGRADAAVTLLEETVRQAPKDASAREALVRAYLGKRDLAAARVAAEDLKTLEPQAAVGPYLAGLIAERQNRVDDCRREFERALALQPPGTMDALAALTRLELAHGEGAAALSRSRAASLANPKDPIAQNILAEVLLATHAWGDGIAQLNRIIALTPRWPVPYRELAMARLETNDGAAAEAAYQAGLRQTPYDALLTSELARLYEQQGRIAQAIALYEGLHAHDPRLEFASNNLAMLLVNYRTDRASLDRARELSAGFTASDNGALLDTHGWVQLKLGEVSDALSLLERAADRAPDSKVIHYHLGVAELKAGERDKARTELESALSGGVHFPGSEDARATLNSLTLDGRG